MKKVLRDLYFYLLRIQNRMGWKSYLKNSKEINIVVGAGGTSFPGWYSTDVYTLNLTKREDFEKYFSIRKIDKVLAEHVLEHLTEADLKLMLANLSLFTEDSVNIRIAVPDGYHEDDDYINKVKPGGYGAGSDDHKHLFTYKTLSSLFEEYGFIANPIEYWDENKSFHSTYKNDDKGYISRCKINDDRNLGGKLAYTSLIIDFTKK